jgi:hypothetical protein
LLAFTDNIKYAGSFSAEDIIKRVSLSGRGRLIMLSDFMYPIEELERAVKYFAYKKQEISLIMITSENELPGELDGEVTLTDSESGEEISLEINAEVLAAYKKAFNEHKGKIAAVCKKYGAAFIDIGADEQFSKILGKILY